jgi:hypothetical protein
MENESSFDLGAFERAASQKTVTAWSAHVEPKSKTQGRRTYSRRLSTGGMQPKAGSILAEESSQSTSPEENSFRHKVEGETEDDLIRSFREDVPALPGRRRFTRTNSMSVVSNEVNVSSRPFLMQQRASSVSNTSASSMSMRSSTSNRLSTSMRSSTSNRSTSLASFGDYGFENIHPNFDPLLERASPKRGAGNDTNERGKKKVRSARHFGERGLSVSLPVSNSFSNLARHGEEGPKWGKLAAQSDLSPFPPKSQSLNDFDVPDYAPSPSASSLGSPKKRGVCASPLYDFDENSIGGLSTSRSKQSRTRSPLFTPPSSKLPDFSAHSADRKPKISYASLGESMKDTYMDSDDGTKDGSEGEESGEEGCVENMGKNRPPIPTFVPFSRKKRSALAAPSVAASPRITNLIVAKVSSADEVIKSMSSYEDLKFITKTLRRERSCCSQSWFVAPPSKWVASRRVAFFQWTTGSLGFTFRSGGNSVSYVQVSQTKGRDILKVLEDTLTQHKEKCKTVETPGNQNRGIGNFSFVDSPAMAQIVENGTGLPPVG